MANRNATFLGMIDHKTKAAIIDSIADHYGRSSEEILLEVADAEAEDLLDYMQEPMRSATSVLMQRHGV